jgi:hypothetical protein
MLMALTTYGTANVVIVLLMRRLARTTESACNVIDRKHYRLRA